MNEDAKPASVTMTITGEGAEVWIFQAIRVATFEGEAGVDLAFNLRDRINAEAETWEEIHHDGTFLLDIEHDPAALQALETYAYAVNLQGDRPLCDELIEKINEVRKRRKA